MKKIFSILSIFFISLSALMLTGCGCNHYWEKISNTATCESDGVITYKCSNCGETKTETSYAIGHNWNKEGSTATCTSSGVATYKCNNCNKTKTRPEQALGHDYASTTDLCRNCGGFRYNIIINQSLPFNVNYKTKSGHIYTSATITDLSFYKYNSKLEIYGHGKKTYDDDGEFGTEAISFSIKLVDSNGNTLNVSTVHSSDSSVGVGTTFSIDYTTNFYVYNLSESETYYLTIADYTI